MTDLALILSSLVLSFVCTFFLMPRGIRWLHHHKMGKQIRDEALIGSATEFKKIHAAKTGTPTMGWAILLLSIGFIVLLSVCIQWYNMNIGPFFGIEIRFSLWNRNETYIALFTLMSVGCIWLVDDYLNIREIGRTKGLSARVKMVLLSVFWFIGAYWFYVKLWYSSIHIPKYGLVDIGFFYIPLFIFILVAMANSVNITDGLDGLAGGLLMFIYTAYAIICYFKWLHILAAFCLIIVGALLAFLWFNIKPAKIFLGDVGSLSLGATLTVIAFMTDTLLVLLVVSLIFVFETISVILQLLSKRFRGKKLFRIAPFHHHLEAIWWREETIVMRFWLIGMVLSVAGVILGLVR